LQSNDFFASVGQHADQDQAGQAVLLAQTHAKIDAIGPNINVFFAY